MEPRIGRLFSGRFAAAFDDERVETNGVLEPARTVRANQTKRVDLRFSRDFDNMTWALERMLVPPARGPRTVTEVVAGTPFAVGLAFGLDVAELFVAPFQPLIDDAQAVLLSAERP